MQVLHYVRFFFFNSCGFTLGRKLLGTGRYAVLYAGEIPCGTAAAQIHAQHFLSGGTTSPLAGGRVAQRGGVTEFNITK